MIAPGPVAVVPAAGAARRFGGGKLVADIRGEPLLQYTLRALLDAGVPRVVLVAAAVDAFVTVPAVADPRVQVVLNSDPARGMFSSVLAGLAEVDRGGPALVLPADMPFIRAASIEAVLAAHRASGQAVVASYRGRRGHPVVLPASIWPELLDQSPLSSLKDALAGLEVELRQLEVEDAGVLRDVDSKTDLE